MARIFTLDFDFKGMKHNALVAMLWNTDNVFFSIRLDKQLEYITPGCVLSLSNAELELSKEENKADAYEELESSIRKAIKSYLSIADYNLKPNE